MSEEVASGVIIDPDPRLITIKRNTIWYRVLATRLKEGSRVFIPNMGRKEASYARKRFTELVGREVLGYPIQVSGKDGYLFHILRQEK